MRSWRMSMPTASAPRSGRRCPPPGPRPSAAELMHPPAEAVERFAADLGVLVPADTRIGIAVSGGPDSLALLLLAQAACAHRIEAATVDHGLRPESAGEAAMVADLCGQLGITHSILLADWSESPATNQQAAARAMRY